MGNFKDLTGQRFGKLTVIERCEDYISPKRKKHLVQWLCRCDCGNKIKVLSIYLKRGNIKSCNLCK